MGILIALIFIGLPFVIRTLQPVLEELEPEIEEAAVSLGANRGQTFWRIFFPQLTPAFITGFALAFARAIGEYGSVIFIAGNMPMVSEITPLLIITKLEQYDYKGAAAIAVFMLMVSFLLLLAINLLQLARVLAIEPKVLLLDEHFGALDAKVRKELRNWLRRLHDEAHITSVFVTHDQEEAMEVADRIVVMNEGKIEQIGTPEEIYEHPANPFVFNFLGSVNLFHGRIFKGCALMGNFEVNLPEYKHLDDIHDAVGYVRPHDLEIQLNQAGSDFAEVTIGDLRCVGPLIRLELKKPDNGEKILAEISRKELHELKLKIGQTVFVRPRKLKVFTLNT